MKTKKYRWASLVVVVAVVAALSGTADAKGVPSARKSAGGAMVDIHLYVMSRCPFASRMMDVLIPVVRSLKPWVRFHVDYFASIDSNGNLQSLHGPDEVLGDKAQLCAHRIAPGDRHLAFLECQYKGYRNVATNWQTCASRARIPINRLSSCINGSEGEKLLRASAARTRRAKAPGSPTIFFNGVRYRGARTKRSFLRAICQAAAGGRLQVCQGIAKPVSFDVFVLTDRRCKLRACLNFPRIAKGMIARFRGAKVHYLDYGTAAGKRLFRKARLQYLPAILFSKEVRKTDVYRRYSQWLRPSGPYFEAKLGIGFDPTKEICDNGIDDTHNGKVDCADPDCRGKIVCRKSEPMRLDMFVMSLCPFANRAFQQLPKVLRAFGGRLRLHIHYVGRVQSGGRLSSLHGPAEVAEDLRQICVQSLYPKQFVSYLACRGRKRRARNWQACVGSMDPARIQSCSKSRRTKRLLAASFAFSKKLGIDASPSWLVNNRYKFKGLTARRICEAVTKRNPRQAVDCRRLGNGFGKIGPIR